MEIYHTVQQRMRNTLIQMSHSSEGEDVQDGEYVSFKNSERLEQKQVQGGLRQSTKHTFQAPSSGLQDKQGISLLGLDKLASKKRTAHNRMTLSTNDDDDDDGGGDSSLVHSSQCINSSTISSSTSSRNYRSMSGGANDTPSHPGGVHPSARDRQRMDRFSKDGRASFSTSDHRDKDRVRKDSSNEWNRGRDQDRAPWRGSRERREEDRKRSRSRSRDRTRDHDRNESHQKDRERGRQSRGDRFGTEKRVTGVRVFHSNDDWEAPQRLSSVVQSTTSIEDEWENPTPLRSSDSSTRNRDSRKNDGIETYSDHESPLNYSEDEDNDTFDRDFYLCEEGTLSSSGGDYSNSEKFLGSHKKFKEREEAMAMSRMRGDYVASNVKSGSSKIEGMSARKSQLHADQQAWEENRLMQSGVAGEREYNLDIDDENDQRVTLIVHNLKPPFLDGRVSYSLQQSTVSTVRYPTSDFANNARNGSSLLKDVRIKREQMKMRKRFWELGGSAMGNAMGLQKPSEDEASKEPTAKKVGGRNHSESDEEQVDYKQESSFAKHVTKNKSIAQSQFAKSKTIREQREFLPVFTVRDSLLEVIRDSQIVVIVGETGSGKTTQLTQYLHESGYTDYGMVGCTQPRRVAAMSVAKRVSEEFGCELGDEVGYAIRFEDVTGPKTLIKYMTDGVLLRESLREPDLDQYSAIVMDEAHERSLHTDILFGILKKIVMKRRDIKLIITSATLNADKFADFFGGVPIFRYLLFHTYYGIQLSDVSLFIFVQDPRTYLQSR